jgi:hypothetical protein
MQTSVGQLSTYMGSGDKYYCSKPQLIFTSQISLDRKCANPSNGFGAIKVVFTSSMTLSKAIYLVLFRHGEVVTSPALHQRLITIPVVTYLNMVDD